MPQRDPQLDPLRLSPRRDETETNRGARDASILVVDDNDSVRRVVCSMLEEGGFEVCEAANGVEASRILKQQQFDLVITDLVMPEYEGIELIQSIRQEYPGVKVLAISGVGSANVYLKTASLLGATDILAKPFSQDALLSAVNRLIGSPQNGAEHDDG